MLTNKIPNHLILDGFNHADHTSITELLGFQDPIISYSDKGTITSILYTKPLKDTNTSIILHFESDKSSVILGIYTDDHPYVNRLSKSLGSYSYEGVKGLISSITSLSKQYVFQRITNRL